MEIKRQTIQFDRIRGRLITGVSTNRSVYRFTYNNKNIIIHYWDDVRGADEWRSFCEYSGSVLDAPRVPFLPDMSEEELFQYSLVYDPIFPMELLHSIQTWHIDNGFNDIEEDTNEEAFIEIYYGV